MVARLVAERLIAERLAKNLHADRGRAPPVGAFHEGLNALAAAEAQAARLAPSKASLTRPTGGEEPAGNELDRLYAALERVTADDHPRTAKLRPSSSRTLAQKVIEEAGEVALAAVKRNDRGIVRESADLLYHLAVLWRRAGIGPGDVWAEMRRRAEGLGIAEKLPKSAS